MSEVDICPICGEPVKRKNLIRHYGKVHPRRASTLLRPKPETGAAKGPRIRRPRRILFYALIGISVVLVSVAAGEVISVNTIRMHIHLQLSVLIRGATETPPANIGVNQDLWRDHSLDRYGVNGHSPLLTRDSSGTIHVESNTVRNFTLYDFLAVWGESIGLSQVVGYPVRPGESACIFVNDQSMPLSSDVLFVDQQKIILEIPPNSQPCSAIS
ncbi:MAG TPA: hypothetical protein VNA15_07215 [Candidatus Angelobacter sp.]|nr:hypothetical protein [Candidatus Angelobacter sp.]